MAHKEGKKNRKYGKNLEFCKRYKLEGRRERNKRRKMIRHLKRHSGDAENAKRVIHLATLLPGFRLGADEQKFCERIING